jgi:hypothetical protein
MPQQSQPAQQTEPGWAKDLRDSVLMLNDSVRSLQVGGAAGDGQAASHVEPQPQHTQQPSKPVHTIDLEQEGRIAKAVAKEMANQFQPVCRLLGEGFANLQTVISSLNPEKKQRRISFGNSSPPQPGEPGGGVKVVCEAVTNEDVDDPTWSQTLAEYADTLEDSTRKRARPAKAAEKEDKEGIAAEKAAVAEAAKAERDKRRDELKGQSQGCCCQSSRG